MGRQWSCDTVVALRDATASGAVLFGKNSDRPAGEAQPLRRQPSREAGAPLRLAYVSLDDAPAYAHVGSAPFWCWGYEIGVNEHRVAIGNEALFTRPWAEAVSCERKGKANPTGLLGMELVRLGLERGDTARGALDVITALLAEHGQWGSARAGTSHADGSYDNAYLIADPHEAWVLETMGKDWCARRLTSGVESISNEITTHTNSDLTSSGLAPLAIDSGWWPAAAEPFDVADAFSDPGTPRQVSHIRRCRSRQLLTESAGRGGVTLADAKATLRDHLEGSFLGGPSFDASRPDFQTLCMHEHTSGFTWGNTAASLVVELHDDPGRPVVLWWSPVTPCTGVYVPLFVGAELPEGTEVPSAPGTFDPREHEQPTYDPSSVWWRWQQVLDAAKDPAARSFPARAAEARAVFDRLEAAWIGDVPATTDPAALAAFSADCLDEATAAADALLAGFRADPATPVDLRWA